MGLPYDQHNYIKGTGLNGQSCSLLSFRYPVPLHYGSDAILLAEAGLFPFTAGKILLPWTEYS